MPRENEFPITINGLEKELSRHALDGRSDDLFRLAIAIDQFGSLARHITHDQKLNPTSREHGTKPMEINDAGHAIVQLLTYCILRKIPLEYAINSALKNLREKDFMASKAKTIGANYIKGIHIYGEMATGTAYIDPYGLELDKIPAGCILVTKHPTTELARYANKLSGIITDHGGSMCHAAIIAREFKKPCIVSTGDATARIMPGQRITMQGDTVSWVF
jgi:phosphoenolpyruvate synthase/pyruvate phosphate dikinase